MASRNWRGGVERSRLLDQADRNRPRYAVAVASGIWRPQPSSPITIAYLAFHRRSFFRCTFAGCSGRIVAYPEVILWSTALAKREAGVFLGSR